MSLEPTSPDLANKPEQPEAATGEEDSLYYRRILRRLVEIGDEFIELARREACAYAEAVKRHGDPQIVPPLAPSPYITETYLRITCSMRRSIMLAEKLARPKQPAAVQHRILARRKIIRDVEDAIESNAPPGEEEELHAEFLERLDSPDLEEEIASRDIPEIVQDICRDLGVADLVGPQTWKRRTPHDIAVLRAQASQNSLKPAPPAAGAGNPVATPPTTTTTGSDPPAARSP